MIIEGIIQLNIKGNCIRSKYQSLDINTLTKVLVQSATSNIFGRIYHIATPSLFKLSKQLLFEHHLHGIIPLTEGIDRKSCNLYINLISDENKEGNKDYH